jgi:hypothetical protein
VLPPTQMPTELPIRPCASIPHADHAVESHADPQCQMSGIFRPSMYNSHVDGFAQTISHMPLTTSIFKK